MAQGPAPGLKKRRYSPKKIGVLLVVVALLIVLFQRSCGGSAPEPGPEPVTTPEPEVERVVDCSTYPYKHFSKHLKDRLPKYKELSLKAGITPIEDEKALAKAVANGTAGLVHVKSTDAFMVSAMDHGRPYLTPAAHKVLLHIAETFQQRISNSDVADARLKVTSLLRTRNDQRDLGRSNVNATKAAEAPHTHGTSMDISYMRFVDAKGAPMELAACQQVYLAETLAEVIHEMRKENKLLFATREAQQACYHLSVCYR